MNKSRRDFIRNAGLFLGAFVLNPIRVSANQLYNERPIRYFENLSVNTSMDFRVAVQKNEKDGVKDMRELCETSL